MRESIINTLKRVVKYSQPEKAATWLYRMVVLAVLTVIALHQAPAATDAEVVYLSTGLVKAGAAIAGLYLLGGPIFAEIAYRMGWGVEG